MKKNIFKGLVLGTIVVTAVSCNFLDIEPLDTYTENNVFSDVALTDAYITRNYKLFHTGYASSSLRFVCDESMNSFNWGKANVLSRGEMTPDQFGDYLKWKDIYSRIRACNIFFNNIEKLQADERIKNMLIGEMTFLRALYYMDLVNRVGGVPLITSTFELDDPNMLISRNSYDECANFIVSELDKAATLLPLKHNGEKFGRATKGAALAYKSRMLLYMASPLWNTSSDVQKWQAAADAAKAVMDLGVYSLDSDYKGLFLNIKSPEIIFQRLYNDENANSYDRQNSPNGYGGWNATCVLQQMVDSYEMEDGTLPALTFPTKDNPYQNRDPRFYASIVVDGMMYRGRETEFWVNEGEKTGGLDSKFGPESWNVSKSGYSIRKFMNENLTKLGSDKSTQSWVYARYAEIYLNYAEALYNLGREKEAREYVNVIRKRARGGKEGIVPDITASGAELLAKIQHERKIELAFEEHRFFDVRRWKIAEKTEVYTAQGVKIIKYADGSKQYSLINLEKRNFVAPNHYLLPIPRSEIQKNDKLVQNPGYN